MVLFSLVCSIQIMQSLTFCEGVPHDGPFQFGPLESCDQRIDVDEDVVVHFHHVTGRAAKPKEQIRGRTRKIYKQTFMRG